MPSKHEVKRQQREFSRRERAKRERSSNVPLTGDQTKVLDEAYRIFAEQLIASGDTKLATIGIDAATEAVRGLHEQGIVEVVSMHDGIALRVRDKYS